MKDAFMALYFVPVTLVAFLYTIRHATAISVPKQQPLRELRNEDTPTEDLPTILYRGDTVPPTQYQLLGGIPPEFTGPTTNDSYSLMWHQNGVGGPMARAAIQSAYAATSIAFSSAVCFALDGNQSDYGWMYQIQATPNIIDLHASLLHDQYPTEREFSALGGIRWDQIRFWAPISKNVTIPHSCRRQEREFRRCTSLEELSGDIPGLQWIKNDDYNPAYNQYTTSGGQPQLAGDTLAGNIEYWKNYGQKTLEQWADEFMDSNGGPVGWKGSFPLDLSGPAQADAAVFNLG